MKMEKEGPSIPDEINRYWSAQRNNEIFLKGRDVPVGSPEYWQIFETERSRYIYYRPKVLAWFLQQKGMKLLEVGCGMGIDSGFFAHNGFDVTGIDLAEFHIQLAREYFRFKGLDGSFELGNAEKLPYQDRTFDCLYSFGVMHHTQTPQNAIDEALRVLKPGGHCFVMLYSKYSLNNFVHKILQIPYDNIHERRPFGKDANFVYRYSKREVYRMFDKFSEVRVESEYLFGAGWGKVFDLTPKYLYHLFSKIVGWHLAIYARK